MGMTRRDRLVASAIRASVVAVLAAIVAVGVAISLSPFGPIGIGRAAEPHPGVAVDWTVLGIGVPIVVFAVMLFALIPVATLRIRAVTEAHVSIIASHGRVASSRGCCRVGDHELAAGRAPRVRLGHRRCGLCSRSGGRGLVAGDQLRRPPGRAGEVRLLVGRPGRQRREPVAGVDTRVRLESIPGIEAVGSCRPGNRDDPTFTVFAGEPFLGDVDFGTITAGRAPTKPTEVALGRHEHAPVRHRHR